MRTQRSVTFLGYDVSKNRISLSDHAIERLKLRCGKIIYRNLLMFPKRLSCIPGNRIDRFGTDWDLLACIAELRLMLYGEITEHKIGRYLAGRSRLKSMPGAISYYCMVEKVEQFSKLDGWLVWAIIRALTERYKYPTCGPALAPTAVLQASQLIDGSWLRAHRRYDGRLPSFVSAWRAGKKAWFSYGNLGVSDGRENYEHQ